MYPGEQFENPTSVALGLLCLFLVTAAIIGLPVVIAELRLRLALRRNLRIRVHSEERLRRYRG